MKTVRIVKNWTTPDIFRQTPQGMGIWKNIQFTTDEIDKPDYVIVLNYSKTDVSITCSPDHIWAVMQEPYIRGVFDWMVEKHEVYAKVFTHYIFSEKDKYIRSYPMLVWHVDKSYDELKNIDIPVKTELISWITSNKEYFPGHQNRMTFLNQVKKSDLEIDLFGRGIKFIEDKWDGLAPYKYSLAIENSSSKDYWSEKLADCFLSYTLPFYYGCTNIDEYFPKDAYIKIDISKPEEAFKIIQNAIKNNEFEKRFKAICVAREMILEKYNFFAAIEKEINTDTSSSSIEEITLKVYTPSIVKKLESYIIRLSRKLVKLYNKRMKKK